MRALASLLLSASVIGLSMGGCAVRTDVEDVDDTASESADALSAYGKQLTGSYKMASGTGDFTWIVLRDDGTYFTETQIFCVRAPCINPRDDGRFIGYKPRSGSSVGSLRLISKKGVTRVYKVSLDTPHERIGLSTDGSAWGKYATVGSFCDTAKDCDGQNFVHPMCVGEATCTSAKTCGWRCGVKACDYTSDTTKRYVGKSTAECSVIKFACAAGEAYFSDGCGCGCQKVGKPCVVGGCSGQICAETSMISTCEWRPEYACYSKLGTCERDGSGACGWRKTPELSSCLAGK